jgi:ornithine cyclodeaminase/alanine dehydrogenase-like protein (mu-crystallin family)
MDTLIISQSDVPELLPMDACIDAMAEALLALAQGHAVLPLRSMVWMPDKSGLLGLMPAYLGAPKSLGLKVISYLPKNHGSAPGDDRRQLDHGPTHRGGQRSRDAASGA